MKTKHLNTSLSIVTALLTVLLFNNFAFFAWTGYSVAAIGEVHEASRIAHAKELLGKSYLGSAAQMLEGQASINQMILDKVEAGLAPQWKSYAPTIASTVISESTRLNFDPIFVLAIIQTESRFNPIIVGGAGEIGLMQIKPDTAKWIARKNGIAWDGKKTLQDPVSNIKIGVAYMNYLRGKFQKTPMKYVSAYNMGPLNVRRLIAKNIRPYEYRSKVMKNYSYFYANMADRNNDSALVASN